jgi:hypothetical protein
MDRKTVYAIIDTERSYQDVLGPDRTVGDQKKVGEYLTMLRSYAARADDEWTFNAGDKKALEQIRKIAAICVKCMEEHGAEPRITKAVETSQGEER